MTAAYDLFVRELGATGREFGDGFSVIDPAELTPEERVKTRDALRACIARQEERAPKPLASVVDAPEALDLLECTAVGDGGIWITGAAMEGLIHRRREQQCQRPSGPAGAHADGGIRAATVRRWPAAAPWFSPMERRDA